MPVLNHAQVYGASGYLLPNPVEGGIRPRHWPDDIIYVNERLGEEGCAVKPPRLVARDRPIPSPADLGPRSRLREVRKSKKLKQSDLAVRLKMSQAYLSNLENGKANVSLHTLRRIAKVLKVKVADLVADE